MRRILCMLLCVLLCLSCAACRENKVAGIWKSLEPSEHYFELYEDGTCMMFDNNHEWVSSGTYTDHDKHIVFETDTGTFTWVWDKKTESMLFESADGVLHYRLKK